MKLSIIAHTPNIESVIASSGRLCYSKVGVDKLLEKHTKESNEKFVKMLADMGHESPLEHISFTFAVEGISRACSHQLVRHRIASYSQQSQRYVPLNETFEYIIPPAIKKVDLEYDNGEKVNLEECYKNTMESIHNAYETFSKALELSYIEKGMSKKEANKKAIEDARYILPNACETKLVFTMNVRTLLNFFEKRCCSRSQWEIRALATEMLNQCRDVSPILFNNAGATCKRGYCKEGDMSCGKLNK